MITKEASFLLDTGGISHTLQPLFRYCGHCQIQAILSYNNIPCDSYKKLSCNNISNHTGFMWPHNFRKIQKKYGIATSVGRAHTIDNRISWLKDTLIHTGQPIILQIAHGYDMKDGNLLPSSLIRMTTMQHWVSIWGFDDEKEVFFIYDTAFPSQDGSLLNVSLSYDDVLHYRKRGVFGIYNYLYVYFGT